MITNTATGVIKGAAYGIFEGSGSFSLTNRGLIVGGILDANGSGNDVVVDPGKILGTIQLGGGNDRFNGTGGRSGPVFGGDGNDRLIGGSHNDQLHGGDGKDKLTGGPGADKFFFDTTLNAVTNVDTITDFRPAQHDKIVLSQAVFSGLSFGVLDAAHFHNGAPVNGNAQIDYTRSTGVLVFDPDGNGGMAPTQFAVLSNHANVHAGDFVVIA